MSRRSWDTQEDIVLLEWLRDYVSLGKSITLGLRKFAESNAYGRTYEGSKTHWIHWLRPKYADYVYGKTDVLDIEVMSNETVEITDSKKSAWDTSNDEALLAFVQEYLDEGKDLESACDELTAAFFVEPEVIRWRYGVLTRKPIVVDKVSEPEVSLKGELGMPETATAADANDQKWAIIIKLMKEIRDTEVVPDKNAKENAELRESLAATQLRLRTVNTQVQNLTKERDFYRDKYNELRGMLSMLQQNIGTVINGKQEHKQEVTVDQQGLVTSIKKEA